MGNGYLLHCASQAWDLIKDEINQWRLRFAWEEESTWNTRLLAKMGS